MKITTSSQALNNLLDINDFKSLRGKSLAHISSKQWNIYMDLQKWQNQTPTLGLPQECIDSVIKGKIKEAEMFDYIHNLILKDITDD